MVNSLMFLRAQFTPSVFVREAPARTPTRSETFSGEVGGNCRRAQELCRSIGARAVQREPAHSFSSGSCIRRKTHETDRTYPVKGKLFRSLFAEGPRANWMRIRSKPEGTSVDVVGKLEHGLDSQLIHSSSAATR
jgi:hypothetical protein